jgi:hypothetical protein
MCLLLIATQLYVRVRARKRPPDEGHAGASTPISPQMTPQRIPVTPAE